MITMTEFGNAGRFGNQILQYMFLRTYAERYDQELQLQPWVGNYLFGHDCRGVTERLPQFKESMDKTGQAYPPVGNSLCGYDFWGYAQFPTGLWAGRPDKIRSWFSPTPEAAAATRPAVEALKGRTSVGLHIRRGDYGVDVFHIIPIRWYIDWLRQHFHLYRGWVAPHTSTTSTYRKTWRVASRTCWISIQTLMC
jgi:hypothetical protein